MIDEKTLTEALFEELERQNKDAQRRDDMPGEIWLSGGCTPQTAGCFIDVAALADVALAEPLTMTGCKDAADLIDMANVGRSLMEHIGGLANTTGRYKTWAPADDPAEIVFDLVNDLEDTEARARTAEEALKAKQEEVDAAVGLIAERGAIRELQIDRDEALRLHETIAEIDRKYPGAFWTIGYGVTRSDEPPYGVLILFGADEKVSEGEGSTLIEAIQDALSPTRTEA